MKKFNLHNMRMWPSRNGYGMSCVLTMNGKAVCDYYDAGDGGQPDVDIINPLIFKELEEALIKLPPVHYADFDTHIKIDVCGFIDALNYCLETKTPFTLLDAA